MSTQTTTHPIPTGILDCDDRPISVGDEIVVVSSMGFYRRTRFVVLENHKAQPISEAICWQTPEHEEKPLNSEPVQIVRKMMGGPRPVWTIYGIGIQKVRKLSN